MCVCTLSVAGSPYAPREQQNNQCYNDLKRYRRCARLLLSAQLIYIQLFSPPPPCAALYASLHFVQRDEAALYAALQCPARRVAQENALHVPKLYSPPSLRSIVRSIAQCPARRGSIVRSTAQCSTEHETLQKVCAQRQAAQCAALYNSAHCAVPPLAAALGFTCEGLTAARTERCTMLAMHCAMLRAVWSHGTCRAFSCATRRAGHCAVLRTILPRRAGHCAMLRTMLRREGGAE